MSGMADWDMHPPAGRERGRRAVQIIVPGLRYILGIYKYALPPVHSLSPPIVLMDRKE